MISVIIPVYNTQQELKKCLASLARQSFKEFEAVVVDDGSQVPIKAEEDIKVALHRISHGGAPRARNYGFNQSRGDLILFCDADMELREDCLEAMKQALDENSEIDFVYANFKYGWKKFIVFEFDREKLKLNNYINTCSMVRRSVVIGWDESLKRFQDWDFWLGMVERGSKGKHINQTLFKASVGRGTMSRWLPKRVYSWPLFRGLKRVKDYELAKRVVAKKHGL